MTVEKILKKFAEKSFSVFEGLKGGPFEHTKTFFRQNVFHFIKNAFATNSRFFSQKYARYKNKN